MKLLSRHRLFTRIAVLVAVLLFSATAVEVAPKAIDVLQDLGWIAADAAEAPTEAAALPPSEDTTVRVSASAVIASVDDAAFDRLAQFAASQPGSVEEPLFYASPITNTDQPDAATLLQGIADGRATNLTMASSPAGGSGVPGSLGLSAPGFGTFAVVMMTPDAETQSELSMAPEAPGADGESASITSEGTTTRLPSEGTTMGLKGEGKTAGVTSEDKTAVVTTSGTPTGTGQTEGPGVPNTPSASELKAALDLESSAPYALIPTPPSEFSQGVTADVSPVAVPEPATMLLLGGGLLALAHLGRRKIAK